VVQAFRSLCCGLPSGRFSAPHRRLRVAAEELGWAWRLPAKLYGYTTALSLLKNRESGGLQVTITLPLRIPAREEDLQHGMNEA
jgi:hypothetical protein